MKQDRDFYLYRYEMNSSFAAGYASQQMMDRDAGKLDMASYCQSMATKHARAAAQYRDAIREIDHV